MRRLSDEHWELIREHFPEEHYPDDRPGRKPVPAREILDAVLWILNTGAQWDMLPQSFPNYSMDAMEAAIADTMGVLRRELPWLRSARCDDCIAQANLR